MTLKTSVSLKLTQKLILTPQLQQAIKLLQLPQLELTQVLNQELTENPFLEDACEDVSIDNQVDNNIERVDRESFDDTLAPLEQYMTFRADEYFEERGSDGRDVGYFTAETGITPDFEHFITSPTSLYNHLNWQLSLNVTDKKLHEIGEVIIGNLDDNGYLTLPDEELAEICKVSVDKVKQVIRTIQEFDPPGICARNLKECLMLQIEPSGLKGTLIEQIIENNLKELKKKNYQAVAKQYNVSTEDVTKAIKLIEGLEPKPGRNFSSHETNYVSPDVYIEKTESGYKIILNDDGLPRLKLNKKYRRLLMAKEELSKDERKFLEEKLRSAIWLIKSLSQRNKTIYKVTESILKFQYAFFESGHWHLKPLNLKSVASDINMHESTVSRVTSNKYLSCPQGIFEFRYFFSNSLNSMDGDVSSSIVKEMVQKIVDEENSRRPLSDDKIAELLIQQKIKIARRTVAKYREELKIPSYSQRKRFEI